MAHMPFPHLGFPVGGRPSRQTKPPSEGLHQRNLDEEDPTINIYAGEVLLTALGWTTYDTHLAEMKELLR